MLLRSTPATRIDTIAVLTLRGSSPFRLSPALAGAACPAPPSGVGPGRGTWGGCGPGGDNAHLTPGRWDFSII